MQEQASKYSQWHVALLEHRAMKTVLGKVVPLHSSGTLEKYLRSRNPPPLPLYRRRRRRCPACSASRLDVLVRPGSPLPGAGDPGWSRFFGRSSLDHLPDQVTLRCQVCGKTWDYD